VANDQKSHFVKRGDAYPGSLKTATRGDTADPGERRDSKKDHIEARKATRAGGYLSRDKTKRKIETPKLAPVQVAAEAGLRNSTSSGGEGTIPTW